ncbi:50S ribosomal protein L19, partial [Escherichia coli]|uniref:50S ribosomal protein L19 n=1 Tax=Escherichia coli TaxID=562 RepID=UPI001BDD6D4D
MRPGCCIASVERSGCLKKKRMKTMTVDIIRQLDLEQRAKIEAKRVLPDFKPGDTVRVNVRVTEGTRTRVQAYEG